jgi:hypothetical protein
MPDITMCLGHGCRARNHCYRFSATPSQMQSYFVDVPGSDKKCDYYSQRDYSNMMYNVIDAETGEVYIDSENAETVGQFLQNFECRIVATPDFIPTEDRDDSDCYVVPSIEVS